MFHFWNTCTWQINGLPHNCKEKMKDIIIVLKEIIISKSFSFEQLIIFCLFAASIYFIYRFYNEKIKKRDKSIEENIIHQEFEKMEKNIEIICLIKNYINIFKEYDKNRKDEYKELKSELKLLKIKLEDQKED